MISPTLLRALRTYVRHAPGYLGKPLLAGRLLNEHLTQFPMTGIARTRFGVNIPVVTSDSISRYLYLFGVWEPHLTDFVKNRLRPGDTFLDVGAHTGYFTMLASRLVGPNGHVIAIEASPQFHDALTQNVQANNCGNVRTVNVAVSDRPRRLTLYLERHTNLGGTTAIRPRTVEASFEVDADLLHQVVTPDELAAARLIKIDVEGSEGDVLAGLTPALDRLHPDVEFVIEVTPRSLAKQGQTVDGILAPLKERGFHVYRLINDYAAASYPFAVHHPVPPGRWRGPISGMTDLVLSRTDADYLT